MLKVALAHDPFRISDLPASFARQSDKYGPHQKKQSAQAWSLMYQLLLKDADTKKDFELVVDENGKPFLKDDPRYISLSHCQDACAVMISDRPCAIDLESLTRVIHDPLKNRIGVQGNDRALAFLMEEEALLKLTGKKMLAKRTPDGMKDVWLGTMTWNGHLVVLAGSRT